MNRSLNLIYKCVPIGVGIKSIYYFHVHVRYKKPHFSFASALLMNTVQNSSKAAWINYGCSKIRMTARTSAWKDQWF